MIFKISDLRPRKTKRCPDNGSCFKTSCTRSAREGKPQRIGIDPFELQGQVQEVEYFRDRLFKDCKLIRGYSQNAVERTVQVSRKFKLLHIDGGHKSENVWADFLLYERFLVPGGYVVFDDYSDFQFSPEVGPAVDRMKSSGLFVPYDILGQLPGYEASFVLRRK